MITLKSGYSEISMISLMGTMSIGRLDKASEGLLLLTTDGKVSYHICSQKVEKEYYAQVDGIIGEDSAKQLSKGVDIKTEDGTNYTTLPCEVNILTATPKLPPRAKKIRDDRHGPTSWVSITLKEGKLSTSQEDDSCSWSPNA